MISVILDIIMPLNVSRTKILFEGGEFILDPYQHFYKLYVYFVITSFVIMTSIIAIDTNYTIIIHQILGLLTIVKHRLRRLAIPMNLKKDNSYHAIIKTIHLHNDALQFVDLIESSYSYLFLVFIGFTIIIISISTSIMMAQIGKLLNMIRVAMFVLGASLHFLYINWTGQQMIDHSKELYLNVYSNEWYNLTKEAKTLLKIVMLRCLKPSKFTAGGLYTMNLESFGTIMESALTYVAIMSSFLYMLIAGLGFCQIPMIPIVLDLIMPLNESRPKILFVKGEYIIDPLKHFYKLYLYFAIASLITVTVVSAIDTTYTACVHQILAIFSIIKHRIHTATISFDSKNDISYDIIIKAIHLHTAALQFIDLIDLSYSLSFLILIGFTIVFISIGTVVVIDHMGAMLDLIRLTLFLIGSLMHFLFISWPGQLVIDHSNDLFVSVYANEWYVISARAKTLLKIVMLRCIKPCILTAGGLYVMNLENFGVILKSALSYMAVVASFR
ncbi:hypothetical protein TSAR_005275 [Trichomalopsis sarcophagae]|uniref:Odorant receptor n=1 Tax=Trichomalopsis sarcophagae TaxID=543379 RepID=A0A232F2N3_9HYME|nr:hypothetical protein TSAR_005275 [Trichomalopsis sarcophagae]